jgi:DinB superfamily
MKTKLLLLCLAVATGCLAQKPGTQAGRTNAQIVDFILNVQEKAVVDLAESMPADKYDFAPTGGEFKGVRTFAEQLKHIAADHYLLGAGILGENSPGDVTNDERGSASVRTKAEIIAYLKDSFAYMHRAAAAIDDAKTPIPTPAISPWPDGTATRLGVAIEDCVHTWDHYGQLVEYLRTNGIVPPGSGAPTKANAPGQTSTSRASTTMAQALDFWISNAENKWLGLQTPCARRNTRSRQPAANFSACVLRATSQTSRRKQLRHGRENAGPAGDARPGGRNRTRRGSFQGASDGLS